MACYFGIRKDISPKCEVANCQNHKHQGKFFGDICIPCYEYIYNKNGSNSQAEKNNASNEQIQYLTPCIANIVDAIIITENL